MKIDNREVRKLLDRRDALKASQLEYEEIDKKLKETLRELCDDGEHECGPYKITIVTPQTTVYELPDLFKKKEAKLREEREKYATKVPGTKRVSVEKKDA